MPPDTNWKRRHAQHSADEFSADDWAGLGEASVRLPKQACYVYRVMQNDAPDIHIIGHWNYPTNTVKTI